jgi:hypothetical protein
MRWANESSVWAACMSIALVGYIHCEYQEQSGAWVFGLPDQISSGGVLVVMYGQYVWVGSVYERYIWAVLLCSRGVATVRAGYRSVVGEQSVPGCLICPTTSSGGAMGTEVIITGYNSNTCTSQSNFQKLSNMPAVCSSTSSRV